MRVTWWAIIEAFHNLQVGSDRGYHESYRSYRQDLASVIGVMGRDNSHNPQVTPRTLENPAHNSHNPWWSILETGVKEGGSTL